MASANELYAEAQWEVEGVRRAAARYKEVASTADPATLPSGQRLLRAVVPGLIKAIERLQKEAFESLGCKTGRAPQWAWTIQLLPADKLAVITVVRSLHAMRHDGGPLGTIPSTARGIATAARDELEYTRWVAQQVAANKAASEAQDGSHVDVLAALKRSYPRVHRNVWLRWRRKVDVLRVEPWSQATQIAFGSTLIAALCEAAPQHFSVEARKEGIRTVNRLKVAAETVAELEHVEARAEVARPALMPMIIPPIPWAYPDAPPNPDPRPENAAPVGGYLIHRLDFIRANHQEHTKALGGGASQQDLDAVNAVQATPWRVNQWILDVMGEAWAKGLRLGGLEVGEPLALLPRLPDDAFAALGTEERRERSSKLRETHRENASITGRSQLVLDCLSVATELRDRPAIYYPHSEDFRHRIYCAATRGPNPQGNDVAKSLIMFAEGKPLGDDGLFWLCVRAANCWGYDKATLEERVEWTLGNLEKMRSVIGSPLTSTWWTGAAEPWSFLATCVEIVLALASGSTGECFVSHLPIPMDGSCNGLQHLAAMGLDPTGARATNLTPDPVRQDIYQDVASMVMSLVQQDVLDGVPGASAWASAVTRKTVKRAVMTTPYGVTDRGIRDQLITDQMLPKSPPSSGTSCESQGLLADYMRDKIVQALGGTISSARDIMSWLQTAAERLAKAGLPFDWTTPSGSRVRQAYHVTTVEKVYTLVGEVSLQLANREGGLNLRKQSSGAAPNFVHSCDAAHLTLTVNAAVAAGIGSFAMIHDSYGTHAADTTRLGAELRQAFVDIYKDDVLARLRDEIAGYAPHVVIDPPPVRGGFDVTQVLDAPYFFS